MSVCDVLRQRKRKSCELDKDDEDVEVKRGRLGDDEQSPEPDDTTTINNDDTNGTTNTTAEADQSNGNPNNAKNISDFKRHEPCDPSVPRVLKSAMKVDGFTFLTNAHCSSSCVLTVNTNTSETNMPKKNNAKKSLRFDTVQEFRFNRIQSFVTMPSYGGYSLGMGKYFKSCLI